MLCVTDPKLARARSARKWKPIRFDPLPSPASTSPTDDKQTAPGEAQSETTNDILTRFLERCKPLELKPPKNKRRVMPLEIAARERLWVLAANDGTLFSVDCDCLFISDADGSPNAALPGRKLPLMFHSHPFENGEAVTHFREVHQEGTLDEQAIVHKHGERVQPPKDGNDILTIIAAHNLTVFDWYQRVQGKRLQHAPRCLEKTLSSGNEGNLMFSVKGLPSDGLRRALGAKAVRGPFSQNHPGTIQPGSRSRRRCRRGKRRRRPKPKAQTTPQGFPRAKSSDSARCEEATILRNYFNKELRTTYEQSVGPVRTGMGREEMIRLIIESRRFDDEERRRTSRCRDSNV